ncbi:protein SENESCENCE-ASSOCIATED GENE 21, mitochondrial-like [Malania oleifera]|uniref:protein SENESCENCE-ASSOCIATED GENE 21, mitochondrial-like n=1 Tax=Malania oleifera TaxID=397392 RepID=UPI0025AE15F4|nr:protein SENESCENCE-ASSOCIATED GENE 21, mitochondrial-like [Malania oleifera]
MENRFRTSGGFSLLLARESPISSCSQISNAKLILALVANNVSLAVNKRGYSAATQGVASSVAKGARSGVMVKKQGEQTGKTNSSWVPDPVTGYYRPENLDDEIDVAGLRNMLLKNKH